VLPIFRFGSFKGEDDESYKVALFNYFGRTYDARNSFVVLIPSVKDFNTDLVRYRIGDTIYLNKNVYVFNTVSKRGDLIELRQIDRMDKKFGIQEGDFAFKTTFNDITTGKAYTIGTSDKYTLLDFWGTWCAPCRELTNELKEIHDRYHDKLEIVSIAYDDSLDNVTSYLEEKDIHWPNCFDPQRNSLVTSKFNVSAFPTFILLDKEGKIILRGTAQDALEKAIKILEIK
jgi:thiol-disulfide isomerase/thioredoxin